MNMAKPLQNKDLKYSRADNENIMYFIVQYDLVLRDFYLSHHEKRQYVHNFFRGEALRYKYAEVEPLGNNHADVIAIRSLTRSAKSFEDMVDKSDGDKRKLLRDLVANIEARILLCPRDWRNKLSKVALLTEDWARQHLYSIGKGTNFLELQTQLASALQIHIEVLSRIRNSSKAGPSASFGSKHTIFFTAPKYAESNEETISWIRSRSILFELRKNWISTRSLQEAPKSCHYCSKESRILGKEEE